MNPLHKYEIVGIFLSVCVMALALTFIRFKTDVFVTSNEGQGNSQLASVVVVKENEDEVRLTKDLTNSLSSVTTINRLIVDDVRLGTGKSVQKGDTLVVHYIGATQDGVKFDSSYDRGEAFVFTVGKGTVIQGWEVGLIGMKVGGQRVLVIPSEMGYGDLQVGAIAPHTPLVFAVELLDIR